MEKRYSKEKIATVLLGLKENHYKINITAHQYGISASTLSRWKVKYGMKVWNEVPAKVIEKDEQIEVIGTEDAWFKAKLDAMGNKVLGILMYKLKDDEAIKKISIKDLALILKEILPYILPKFDGDNAGEGNSYTSIFNSFVSNTYNQLKKPDNEQRNNSDKRTPKELPGRDE